MLETWVVGDIESKMITEVEESITMTKDGLDRTGERREGEGGGWGKGERVKGGWGKGERVKGEQK